MVVDMLFITFDIKYLFLNDFGDLNSESMFIMSNMLKLA